MPDLQLLFDALAAWRSVAHIAEWTGLSLGTLGLCAVALYFSWQVAFVRHAALIVGAIVIGAYASGIYMHHVGRTEVLAEWAAAKVKAEEDRKRQDSKIAASTAATFDPIAVQLALDAAARQHQVETPDAKIPVGACRLTDAALRLRRPAKPGRS